MNTRHHVLPRLLALFLACTLIATACDSGEGDVLASDTRTDNSSAEAEEDDFDDEDGDLEDGDLDNDDPVPESEPANSDESGTTTSPASSVDLSLDRDDIDCSDQGLGSDDTATFLVAHVVVDGQLGAVCFGDSSATLISSWETLAAITPPDQLRDLGLFGGFEASDDETGGTTLAFVNTLDDAGTLFQMSVNLDEAVSNPDELMLTMAHEFSHVFTATSPQIDRSVDPDDCDTYFNGEGCYLDGSVLAEWIQLFWGDGLINEIDPNEEATVDSGEQRCAINPSFFGAYAASNPEEDFAESFSAYVFDVPADNDEQEAKLVWIDSQPGLAEFRDRAINAGLGPLDNNFDRCG